MQRSQHAPHALHAPAFFGSASLPSLHPQPARCLQLPVPACFSSAYSAPSCEAGVRGAAAGQAHGSPRRWLEQACSDGSRPACHKAWCACTPHRPCAFLRLSTTTCGLGARQTGALLRALNGTCTVSHASLHPAAFTYLSLSPAVPSRHQAPSCRLPQPVWRC